MRQEVPMNRPPEETLVRSAVKTAERWQNRANALLTDEERAVQEQMRRLLAHPRDKLVLTRLIDQSFRSRDPRRVADQVHAILKTHGVPEFFSTSEKLLVRMFLGLGRHLPSVSVPKLIAKLRHESSRMIIDGEADALRAYLRRRREAGVRVNVNRLGEAVLGEQEAARRLQRYLADLRNPEIEVISVKISTIYSQIDALATEHGVAILVERLSTLYREARSNYFHRADGTRAPKWVYLDMEAYRDLEMTCAAFLQTLEKPEFKEVMAGLALQAYLPEAHALQRRLTAWARERVAAGGSPIMLRIVKGANLEMELVESALFNWPLAPYDNKPAVDANYKRMLRFGLTPENARAARLGIASHNLFELAYAYELGRANQVEKYVHFEMLEGMAEHVRRALSEASQPLLLYAPVAGQDEFINAIAYLVRRLDENTGAENYLRYAPHLEVDSDAWRILKERFVASCAPVDQSEPRPHRVQNRVTEHFAEHSGTFFEGEFNNEPDTDWSLAVNRQWAQAIRSKWRKTANDPALQIPLVVAGREIYDQRATRDGIDPSQWPRKIVTATFRLATVEDIDAAVAVAQSDPDGWRALSMEQRHRALSRVALELRKARGDLIGAAAARYRQTLRRSGRGGLRGRGFRRILPFLGARLRGDPDPGRQRQGRGRGGLPLEFSHRHSLRRHRGCPGRGQHRALQTFQRGRADRLGAVPMLLASRDFTECLAVRAVCRRAGGVPSGDPCRRGFRDPDRWHRHRPGPAGAKARHAALGRDRRQERHHRHRHGRPRAGHQECGLLGLRPRWAEVFGHVAADPGKGGL
jgi:RHH-type proline utilization regulon transcriptional repressor/proline dehydrogenase/delta 1-pyrroline-5-carboxylate dehydrogenase